MPAQVRRELAPSPDARRSQLYQPADAQGISLRAPTTTCPFATGDLDPDPLAAGNGIPLQLYQVNVVTDTLRLVREGSRIRVRF